MICLLLLPFLLPFSSTPLISKERKFWCPHRSSIPGFACRNISSPWDPRSERRARFKLHCLTLFYIALVGPSVAFVGSWSRGLENLKQTQKAAGGAGSRERENNRQVRNPHSLEEGDGGERVGKGRWDSLS